MVTKKNNLYRASNQQYDEIEYVFFCDYLEKQYNQAKKDGLFKILKILELDKEHSDSTLVQALNYFNEKDSIVEKDAPVDFLTAREKKIVHQNEKFRPKLYCMLLARKFAEAIENQSAFMQYSYKYAFKSS